MASTGGKEKEPPVEMTPSADITPSAEVTPNVEVTPTVEVTPAVEVTPPAEITQSAEPISKEGIQNCIYNAMLVLQPEVSVSIEGIEWEWGAEIGLINLYHQVLAEHPELKYTYDMKASVADATGTCVFSYMPYKTGAYNAGTPTGSHIIDSLHAADVLAQSMVDGTERLLVAITNPMLDVDDLQRAVGQAGYGWISFQLNKEGTEIVASAPYDMTLAECASSINETFALGAEILSKIVTDDMTQQEKVAAAYAYVTKNTSYDFRYYSDRRNMPYESTVALGALRDGLAVCGGYSHAFETLLDMLGVENYTVSGQVNGEAHAWNYVVLDGAGYYCDPTLDRGGKDRRFLLTADELEKLGGYEWNPDFYRGIMK